MTARDFITSTLRLIGVLGVGETASAADASAALSVLNQLLESWSVSGLKVWAATEETITLTSGTASYTWGTGGDITTARPVELRSAFIRVAGIDYQVNILTIEEYRLRGLKSTTGRPYKAAYATEYPLGKLYLYPTPDAAYALHARTMKEITALTDLDSTIAWAPGYERALRYGLGVDLAVEYGKSLDQIFWQLAKESKDAVIRRNVRPEPGRWEFADGKRFNINEG